MNSDILKKGCTSLPYTLAHPLHGMATQAENGNWAGFKDEKVMDCMECRCCEYICSSKIPLVTLIKMGKNAVRGMK